MELFGLELDEFLDGVLGNFDYGGDSFGNPLIALLDELFSGI